MQDHWDYDPANAKGAPATDERRINGATERWTGHVYDSLVRQIQAGATQALIWVAQQAGVKKRVDFRA